MKYAIVGYENVVLFSHGRAVRGEDGRWRLVGYGEQASGKSWKHLRDARRAARRFYRKKMTALREALATMDARQVGRLYRQFAQFARQLRAGTMSFPRARELFGIFYCEHVVFPATRGRLPRAIYEYFDSAWQSATESQEGLLKLFTEFEREVNYSESNIHTDGATS